MKDIKTPVPVTVAIITVITVISWIVFGVIRIITKHEGPDIPSEITEPLTPSLNTDVLSAVSQSVYLSDDQIGQIKITQPNETPKPATQSAQLEPTATSSATLIP